MSINFFPRAHITWIFGIAVFLLLCHLPVYAATFTVSNTGDAGAGSLRQAIIDANANVGADTIDFSVSGPITLLSVLPQLSDNTGGTTIDGGGNITLDGSSLGGLDRGLVLNFSGNVIDGLTVSGFPGAGIEILGAASTGNIIRGCNIDANGSHGVVLGLGASDNIVGGTTAAERNIISGNSGSGVVIENTDTTGNVVQGNYIGTDASGTAFNGNTFSGVVFNFGASDNTIGGTAAGAGNIIAGNGQHGVWVRDVISDGTSGNTITRNSIYGNTGEGIVLSDGANGGIAAPVITELGSVLGTAPANATVEIFVDDEDEGEVYLDTVTATGGGSFSSSVDLSAHAGRTVTATATDSAGNTSAFGSSASLVPQMPLSWWLAALVLVCAAPAVFHLVRIKPTAS